MTDEITPKADGGREDPMTRADTSSSEERKGCSHLEDLAKPGHGRVQREIRHSAEVAKVFSQKEGYRALTLVEKKRTAS